jgi:hypothetical protein
MTRLYPANGTKHHTGAVQPDVEYLETHEGVIKARYGDQIPPGVEPVTVSWVPQTQNI